ncbi:MAG: YkgJ family cysteine cluster protein [Phycisphaerae bacterium]
MGSVLCEHCAAACCRYLALPIDKPTSRRDYDDIRWYLMHHGVSLFVEDGDWYIQFQTTCKNLGPDNLCGIYASRPEICSEYEPGQCDYSGSDYGYDLHFTHHRQIEDYYHARTGKRLGDPRPPGRRPRTGKRAKKTKKRKSA